MTPRELKAFVRIGKGSVLPLPCGEQTGQLHYVRMSLSL